MKKSTRRLTVSAMMTALSLIFIYISQLIPTMKLGAVAVAGVAAAVVVTEAGPVYGAVQWAATSALAVVLAPVTGWLYVFIFGWYPTLKCLIERLRRRAVEYGLKLVAFYAAFLLLYFLIPSVIGSVLPRFAGIFWLLSLICVAAFVLYDLFLSRFISFYLKVIYPKIR